MLESHARQDMIPGRDSREWGQSSPPEWPGRSCASRTRRTPARLPGGRGSPFATMSCGESGRWCERAGWDRRGVAARPGSPPPVLRGRCHRQSLRPRFPTRNVRGEYERRGDPRIAGWPWRDGPDRIRASSAMSGERHSRATTSAGPAPRAPRQPPTNAAAASRINPSRFVYGATTCASGYVWREADSSEYVCVSGVTRAQTAADNAAAASRVNPTGPYGPHTCIVGYVWREAFLGDYVCVTGATRAQAAADNAAAAARIAHS
jgi:hypothetical protein